MWKAKCRMTWFHARINHHGIRVNSANPRRLQPDAGQEQPRRTKPILRGRGARRARQPTTEGEAGSANLAEIKMARAENTGDVFLGCEAEKAARI